MASRLMKWQQQQSKNQKIESINFRILWKEHQFDNAPNYRKISYRDSYVNALPIKLKEFRATLLRCYAICTNTRISFVDDDGEEAPLNTENDFKEAWMCARRKRRECGKSDILILIWGTQKDKNSECYEPNGKVTESNKAEEGIENQSNQSVQVPKPEVTTSTSSSMVLPTVKDVVQKMNEIELEDTTANQSSSCQLHSNNSPPAWFKDYMDALKKDMIEEVSSKVIKNVLEALHKQTAEPVFSFHPKDIDQSTTQMQPSHSKQHHRHTLFNVCKDEKRHYKKRKGTTKEGRSSNALAKHEEKQLSRNMKMMKEREKKLQKKFDTKLVRLQEKIRMILEKKKRYCHTTEIVNNLDRGTNRQEDENTEENAAHEVFVSQRNFSLSQSLPQGIQSACDNGDNLPDIPNYKDSKLCMSCSMTGHQMLDKDNLDDTMICSGSDINNMSIHSDSSLSEINDEQNFEMIHMPSNCCSNITSCNNCSDAIVENELKSNSLQDATNHKKLNFSNSKEENNGSSTDSPSFELLSETPSPPVSIYIDEYHFSTNEHISPGKNISDNTKETNLEGNTLYVVDINGKVYNKDLSEESEKYLNTNLNKRTGGAYSFVADTLPVSSKDSCLVSESAQVDGQAGSACDMNIDVKTSHTSYPTNAEKVDTERSNASSSQRYQSQTDLDDFAQSFHSHTTSVTGNDVYASSEMYASTNKKHTVQVHVDHKKSKESTESKPQRATNESERSNSTRKDSKPSKIGDKQYDRTSQNGTVDPVHILPETLVTGAAHVASIAYGTAREVLEKFRAHTKDDIRFKRRAWH